MRAVRWWFEDRMPRWRRSKKIDLQKCSVCGTPLWNMREKLSIYVGFGFWIEPLWFRTVDCTQHGCGSPFVIYTERGEEKLVYGVGIIRAVERWADDAGLKPNEIVRVSAYSAYSDYPEPQFFKVGHGGRGSVAWEDKE